MSDKKDILLGVDFGTGGCKVSAVGRDGVLLSEASVEFPTEHAKVSWSEQNPDDWYPAMLSAIDGLRAKGVDMSRVKALAFDGSTHNAVLLDSAMRPVRKTIMWTDQRSVEECKFLLENYGGKIFATTYQMPAPTWTLPQLMWLKKHEPSVLERVKYILFVKDYVRYLCTGVAITDRIEAQGTLFFNMEKSDWDAELVALSGISKEVLPDLCSPTDVVGKITSKAAKDTGIPEGTPVVCGTSDSAVEDYGAGAVNEGDCILKLATAGNVNLMTNSPHPLKTTLTYSHVVDGMWYTVSATNAAALCLRWFRDTFCKSEISEAEKNGERVYNVMDRLAETSDVGAGGVMFHPYLQGERSPYWDAKLLASFTGISVSSKKSDFVRAVMEGVAFSLKDCYGALSETGVPLKRIILIGGGARSKIWSSIICDVFNLPVIVSQSGDASYGSALLAGVGAGFFKSAKSAVEMCAPAGKIITPNAERASRYAKLFVKYKSVHDALAPVYGQQDYLKQ